MAQRRLLWAGTPPLSVIVPAGALWLLIWAAPPRPPVGSLAQIRSWVANTPADQVITVLASLLGWGCVCYLTGGALLLTLGRLPGWVGAACQAVGERVTPRLLRRLVEGIVGTALAGGSLAGALPAGATPTVAVASITASPASSIGALPATASARRQPADTWPDLDRPGRPSQPAPAGAVHRAERPGAATAPSTITVAPGDTLWDISRRRLGDGAEPAAIASAWPRWYAANRSVIGPDPDLLYPGQVLRAPD